MGRFGVGCFVRLATYLHYSIEDLEKAAPHPFVGEGERLQLPHLPIPRYTYKTRQSHMCLKHGAEPCADYRKCNNTGMPLPFCYGNMSCNYGLLPGRKFEMYRIPCKVHSRSIWFYSEYGRPLMRKNRPHTI